MIEVVTPAPTYDLTTLAAVKLELGLTDAAADSYLARLITSVSSAIKTYCGDPFVVEEVKESLAYPNQRRAILGRRPVASVSQVEVFLSDVSPVTYRTLDPREWRLEDNEAGFLQLYASAYFTSALTEGISFSPVPGSEWCDSLRIQYVGGYRAPGFGVDDFKGLPDLPPIIESVAIELVTTLYRRKGRDPDISSIAIGDYRVTYSKSPAIVIDPSRSQDQPSPMELLRPFMRLSI